MKIFVEKEAESFLEKEGFPIVKRAIITNETQLLNQAKKMGFPLVLKIVSSKILHKTDVGGVKLNLKTEDELKNAFNQLKKIKNFEAALLQKYIEGNYILIGIKKDPTFGHIIAVGLGGIFTEVIKDVVFKVCPLTEKDALDMIKELKSYSLFKGIRGKKINIDSTIKIILKISNLAKKYPNIKELDINPIVINEKNAIITDARIIFE